MAGWFIRRQLGWALVLDEIFLSSYLDFLSEPLITSHTGPIPRKSDFIIRNDARRKNSISLGGRDCRCSVADGLALLWPRSRRHRVFRPEADQHRKCEQAPGC